MHVEVRGHARVDGVEELQEFLTAMPTMTFADHLPGRHIERRKQGRGPVATVVVRAALGRAERHRQTGAVRSSA